MARQYHINYETIVKVRGGAHLSGTPVGDRAELGLCSEAIVVSPHLNHYDVLVDDFGPLVPAEVLWQLSEVRVRMTLVHYDKNVLDTCIAESMGGKMNNLIPSDAGILQPAGTPMGSLKPIFSSGNHYISVNLISAVAGIDPWRFRSCYLTGPPLQLPLGTHRTMALLEWRAIPYTTPTRLLSGESSLSSGAIQAEDGFFYTSGSELFSSGVVLWDHVEDE